MSCHAIPKGIAWHGTTINMEASMISYSKSIFLFAIYFFIVLTAFSYVLKETRQIVYFEWGMGTIKDNGNFIKTELKLNFNLIEKLNLPFKHVSLGFGPLYFLKVQVRENREDEAYRLMELIARYLDGNVEARRYYFGEYGENFEETLVGSQIPEVFKVHKNELALGIPPLSNKNIRGCFKSYTEDKYWQVFFEKKTIFVDKNGDKVVICVDK